MAIWWHLSHFFQWGQREVNTTESFCVSFAQQLNKKGDLVYAKALAQMDSMIPVELKPRAQESLEACKQHGEITSICVGAKVITFVAFFVVKFSASGKGDPCDKTYAFTKCLHDFDPPTFDFP
jgi:hypothetical protein